MAKKERWEWVQSWCDETAKRDLPRALLIGDSITRGYQNMVRKKLVGVCYVDYISTSYAVDKMISIASLVYTDATSDGKTIDDTFGLSSDYGVPYASIIQASNINLVEQNEKGIYDVSLYNDKNKQNMSDLVDKLSNLVKSDSAYFDGSFHQ